MRLSDLSAVRKEALSQSLCWAIHQAFLEMAARSSVLHPAGSKVSRRSLRGARSSSVVMFLEDICERKDYDACEGMKEPQPNRCQRCRT